MASAVATIRPVTLVLGDEELLVARAVSTATAAVRAADPEADVSDLVGAEVEAGHLLDLTSPSLFGTRRVIVIRGSQDLDKEAAAAVLAYLADPVEEISVVLAHAGGVKGKAFVEAVRALGPARVQVVDCPRLKWASERETFVKQEVHATGGSINDAAVRALLAAVGSDLRELATACSQLVADIGGVINEEKVARYYRGKAEATGFVVADRAVDGDVAGALEVLRWGLDVGLAPVLVTSALAGNLRSIAKVAHAGRGSAASLVKQLGMPAWKIEKAQRQARAWQPTGIAKAISAVAAADAEVKGAGTDPAYALERAVLAIVAARGR
ncbi:MAG: polymerase subunit delta [Frankiales bacterium]|jgi:DNA polymerase-3 subunit delta|nr:polymerase subunit delta [Frankiales bacterium]